MLSIRSRGIIPEVLLTTRDEVKKTDPWVPEQEDAIDGGGGRGAAMLHSAEAH